MPTIKFTTNLPIGNAITPGVFDSKYFKGFPASGSITANAGVPDKPGVYIVGVKIDVKGQGEKFCPLYVGIRNSLKARIPVHQQYGKFTTGYLNGLKELFDLTQPINNVYSDISLFMRLFIGNTLTKSANKPNIFNQIKSPNTGNNSLIWFPDPNFFNIYLNVSNSKYPIINRGHWESIRPGGDLDQMNSNNAIQLKTKINQVKGIIFDKFYYAFCEITNENFPEFTLTPTKNYPEKSICRAVEADTKNALAKIGIYTYGASNKPTGKFKIDLSAIQSELVNMTGAPFSQSLIL